jgi:ZIP family zinc transporter
MITVVVSAFVFGIVASSSLVIGAVIGASREPSERVVAIGLAFASGALIAALAFELFQRAFEIGGMWIASGGLLVGAGVFAAIDYLLDEYYMSDERGFTLLAAVTLDGIPENLALGVVLIGQNANPLALLVAIFASNLPEALSGTIDMKAQGHSGTFVVGVWTVAAVLLTVAVVAGNMVFASVGSTTLAVVRAFAGGAVLASLADELMPDAYRNGGPVVAFATAAGFLLAFVLS